MKVAVKIKEELTDSETDYSSDVSNTDSVNSIGVKSTNGEAICTSTTFTNFDGVHTGVPTRTTPTLTPTTLRNIEQTFIELQRETERAEPHHNEAGFVPPVVEPFSHTVATGKTLMSLVYSKEWIGGSTTITTTTANSNSNSSQSSQGSQASQGSQGSLSGGAMNAVRPSATHGNPMALVQPATVHTTRRNMGGRRPAKNSGISPEEEERRRVRRERNKLAAARCRKRRLDHTNELQKETEGLEQKRQNLQNEIQALQSQKEQLSFLLQAHSACCRLSGAPSPPSSPPDVKPLLVDEPHAAPAEPPRRKPPRPSSLPVAAAPVRPATTVLEVAGVPITTPSAGIPFNFESLMDGGTGLTPVGSTGLTPMVPSCSSQQRTSSSIDLASPESSFPPKLVSL